MSMIIDGTSGVTFPNSTVQASAGQVLQVVNGTYSNASWTTTTSTSFVSTPLTASITPKFSTSKILVTASYSLSPAVGNSNYSTIYRNSTNLGNSSAGMAEFNYGDYVYTTTISFLDSPATTSSTTYTLYFRTSAGTARIVGDSVTCSITLQEIAV
jgi:hypothetical protein